MNPFCVIDTQIRLHDRCHPVTHVNQAGSKTMIVRSLLDPRTDFTRLPKEAHSERRLLTGFAIAALIAWKLMVTRAINMATIPDSGKTQIFIFIL
jgi:hypothetical protein